MNLLQRLRTVYIDLVDSFEGMARTRDWTEMGRDGSSVVVKGSVVMSKEFVFDEDEGEDENEDGCDYDNRCSNDGL